MGTAMSQDCDPITGNWKETVRNKNIARLDRETSPHREKKKKKQKKPSAKMADSVVTQEH